MKRANFVLCLVAVAISSVINSCRPSGEGDPVSVVDNQKPVISVEGLKDGSKFKLGEEIKTSLKFSDNVDLASWRIDIVSDTEDGKTAGDEKKKWENVLKDLSGKISGKEVPLEKIVLIPEDVELGKYKFVVYLTDSAGNESIDSRSFTIFDKNGYDDKGLDENGYDERGFDKEGVHKETKTKYDEKGFDREGFNKKGFNRDHIHRVTGTKFGEDGYGEDGYDKWGYDRKCYDRNGIRGVGCGAKPINPPRV